MRVGELFTTEELRRARALFRQHGPGSGFVDAVTREITAPALPRINARTGQENDARYLAYYLEFAIGGIGRSGS